MRCLRMIQFFFCLLLLFIVLMDNPTVHAESNKTYQVGTSNLNVRIAPSESAEVIGKLNPGDQVVAFNESHGWIQTYFSGKEAWVASHFLYDSVNQNSTTNTTETSTEKKGQLTIEADNVLIRTGAGEKYEVISTANGGDSFPLLDTENDWHKIDLGNGSVGWVAGWLTDQSNNPSTTPVKEEDHSQTQTSEKKKTKTSKTQKKNTSNQSLAGYNIVLDPGHGGTDPGTIGPNGLYEKDVILSTTNVVAQKLRDLGAKVIMTRTTDIFVPLNQRIAVSHSFNTHAFISLHYDSYPDRAINGMSTHYYTAFGNDRKLASSIQEGLAQSVNMNSRGIMNNGYHVLRKNKHLAVLVELGFLTNPSDNSAIQTTEHRQQVSEGIANGLVNYFNN